jgi:Tfp pilus assembly protein PilZ
LKGGPALKKRSCKRFSIPGTIIYYKNKPRFFGRSKYTDDYYPVINMSRGGVNFLCDQRLAVGARLIVKVNIPGMQIEPEIIADVKWISKNPEQSYRYQTGIAFSSYGNGRNKNSMEILSFLRELERGTQ